MEAIMRTGTTMMLALGLAAGAASLSAPVSGPAKAQGFYIDAPGIHIGVGDRHHRHYRHYRRYYRGYGAYAADPGHPYGYNYDYGDPRCGIPNYTIQGGVCKPYRGY